MKTENGNSHQTKSNLAFPCDRLAGCSADGLLAFMAAAYRGDLKFLRFPNWFQRKINSNRESVCSKIRASDFKLQLAIHLFLGLNQSPLSSALLVICFVLIKLSWTLDLNAV